MRKVDQNKSQKMNALLQSSFELFIDKGFHKTTLSDITKRAGLAKGTFYLYFKDKYDIRDKLIERKACQLFEEAFQWLNTQPQPENFEDAVIEICDFFVNKFKKDPLLLKFISKHLSWGIFRNVFEHPLQNDTEAFTVYFKKRMDFYQIKCDKPELMLFSVIEFMESTCYSCILFSQPMDIDSYIPYLHRTIRSILCSYIENDCIEKKGKK